MPMAREYRKQARDCLELGKAATDLFAKQSMMELAEEFNKAADELDHSFLLALEPTTRH
jgi:phosphate uptake regulator